MYNTLPHPHCPSKFNITSPKPMPWQRFLRMWSVIFRGWLFLCGVVWLRPRQLGLAGQGFGVACLVVARGTVGEEPTLHSLRTVLREASSHVDFCCAQNSLVPGMVRPPGQGTQKPKSRQHSLAPGMVRPPGQGIQKSKSRQDLQYAHLVKRCGFKNGFYKRWPQTDVKDSSAAAREGSWRKSSRNIFCVPRENKWETSVKSRGPGHPESKCKIMRPRAFRVATKCGRQVGDKCKIMQPRAPRAGDKCGRQVGDKCKNSMRPRAFRVATKCGRQVGDTCKITRPRAPRVGDKCGRQVEDKCKIMRPSAPRVGDKCGWQVEVEDKCKIMRPRAPRVGDQCWRQVGDKCKSCGPEHSEWQPTVGDKWETHVKSRGPERPEWETSGRQMQKACGPEHPERNASPETNAKSCGPGNATFLKGVRTPYR